MTILGPILWMLLGAGLLALTLFAFYFDFFLTKRGELKMTKDQMRDGFKQGRTLIQEEWAHPSEIQWVDELIADGAATATPWEYKDNFQCERRRITGVRQS